MTVQLFDACGLAATTNDQSMQVVAGALTVTTLPLPIDDLNNGSVVRVAQFTDSDPAAVSGDFSATMSWDAASCDCSVVPADGGGFDVYASTSTPFAGSNQPITLTINDSDGASATVLDGAGARQRLDSHARRAARRVYGEPDRRQCAGS